MRFLWSSALSIQFLFLYSLFSFTVTNCLVSVPQTRCHEDESYALLQFKDRFVISESASYDPFSYPKMASWNSSTDCCSWDGIQCDDHTNNVISIDLSSSQIYGTLDANSCIFDLKHLQRLELADKHFNHSQIPSRIGELSQLRYLNLSVANFIGEIPQVSHLSKLLSLDLCSAFNSPNSVNLLSLEVSTLRSLIQNSTKLEIVRLDYVTISSYVPDIFTNLTSLQRLSLCHCELNGEFPAGIFHLPKLRYLNLGYNPNLIGKFPDDFQSSAQITVLGLSRTSVLSFSHSNLSGQIPSSITNLTNLAVMDLAGNNLRGEIPNSFFKLENLDSCILSFNLLEGELELEKFLMLKMLVAIDLSYNKLSLISGKNSSNASLSHIQLLGLGSFNLNEIPNFLRDLTELSYLYMPDNNVSSYPHKIYYLKDQ